MEQKVLFRILKYVLNIAGFTFATFLPIVGFGLIAGPVGPANAMAVTMDVVKDLIVLFLVYFPLLTIINYFAERRFEKRTGSREFLILLIVQFVLLTGWAALNAFAAYDFWMYGE